MKNQVTLIGNLGPDPEIQTMESGAKLVRMRMATNEFYTNKQGEKVADTQWHYVVAWGKTAELAEELLIKGSEIMVNGKLATRSYTDNDGRKRYITEVVANDFLLLTRRSA